MFLYYLRLAKMSLMKQPMLTALMISAIGVGVGACMTITSFIYLMSGDPIPEKSDQLYAVRLDAWAVDRPYDEDRPEQPPPCAWQRDASAPGIRVVPSRPRA